MGNTSASEASAANVQHSPASDGKAPRTARGQRTLRKILDAALEEFGEKGFSEGSIVGITSRARVALGTFYTYFDSKEAVFQELVRDMSAQVRDHVAPVLADATDALDGEGRALASFLEFVRTHRQVYRIIDEAEFVDPEGFRKHYVTTAERIAARLQAGQGQGRSRHRRIAACDGGRSLGDHGNERLPRTALRGLGQGRARRGHTRRQPPPPPRAAA